MEDEIVQYFVVNKDLNMSIGKTAAQVAHVATLSTEVFVRCLEDRHFRNGFGYSCEQVDWFDKWLHGSMTKIVLGAKHSKLDNLVKEDLYQGDIRVFYIHDEGRTEINRGSLTCVGFNPVPKSKIKEVVKRFQLLR